MRVRITKFMTVKKKYFFKKFRIVGCAGGDGAIGGVNIEKDKTAKRPLKSFA